MTHGEIIKMRTFSAYIAHEEFRDALTPILVSVIRANTILMYCIGDS